MVDLLARAKQDLRLITTSEFGVDILVISPDGETAFVRGLASKIHFQFDPETGKPVNAKKAYVSISEDEFNDLDFNIRNKDGEVSLRKYKVEYADSTGSTKSYTVNESYPDETLGLIVCILGDYING